MAEISTEVDTNTKLKAPRVVTFAFSDFKLNPKDDGKWRADCRTCKSVIVEACGTTSGFVR